MTDNIQKNVKTPAQEMLLTIKAWADFLLKKWWILAIVTFIGGTAGFLYAIYTKPIYRSRLTFALDEGGSGSMNPAMSLAAQFGLSIGGSNDIFGGENIIEILKSRRAVESVLLSVDSTDMKNLETMANKYIRINDWEKLYANKEQFKNINFPVGIRKADLSYLQDSALIIMYNKILKDDLTAAHPDKRVNLFEINMESPDEKFSKIFTDKLVEFSSAFYTELKTKKSLQTLEVLEERVNSNKGKLNSSINGRASVQDANVNPAFATAQVQQQQQQANIQTYGAAYGELYKNLELARFQFLKSTPLLQIIDAADYPMKRIKVSRLISAITGGIIAFLFCLFVLAFRNFYRQTIQNR